MMAPDEVIELDDLKSMPHWVGYQLVPKQNGKMDKVPKNPRTGGNASSIDPSTWATAEKAWKANNNYRWNGVGFVFTIDVGIVGVDLDDCFEVSADGVRHFKPWAKDVVQCLDSYTEYSPSGNGVHILASGSIPHSITKNKIGFEMYNEARYFTVTGLRLGDVDVIRERSAELQALHVVFADAEPAPTKINPFKRTRAIGQRPPIDQMRAMLAVLPVHQDYFDWLRICMAVHDVYPGDDGVALIEEWSPGYRGEVANKFRSFDKTTRNGVTLGTLVHMAKQHGYQLRRRGRTRTTFADLIMEAVS